MNIKFVLFDCMETLIDLYKLPSLEDYARWAFDGSGVESLWKGFNEFAAGYRQAKEGLAALLPEHREYEMRDRFRLLVKSTVTGARPELVEHASAKLYNTYWSAYRSQCYVRDDVRAALESLSKKMKLGIVSNFMISGGIGQLVRDCGINTYFSFIHTSMDEGWRKPHPSIYRSAVEKTGVSPGEILFAGDDYINDYVTPPRLGMHSLLLDRYGRYPEADRKIKSFDELAEYIRL